MKGFFLLVEIASYIFILYLIIKKRELAIFYFPFLIFISNVIDPVIPAIAFYASMSALVLIIIYRNPSYYKHNIPAFLLFLYTILLIPRSSDLVLIRPYLFSILWLLTLIPTISAIYLKYDRDVIFKELTNSAVLIISLFIINVIVSTLKGFSPNEMYGITNGILYGNVYAAGFNILSIAIFVIALESIKDKSILNFFLLFVSLSFILLSLRRSVMGISMLGVILAYLTLFTKEKAKTFFIIGGMSIMVAIAVVSFTDFADYFKERYELRKLDERELEEEKRFIEYELLYKDMFVYRDYSPIIGYELFNSWGNYGRGALEERSLHGDLTSITHSSGFIGLALYLLMVFSAFRTSFRNVKTKNDYLIIIFCGLALVAYTITGRYTEIGSMLMLYLVLMLNQAKRGSQEIEYQVKADRMQKQKA